jgi:hypothetical protein
LYFLTAIMTDRLHTIIARTARRVALATALAASGASAIGDASANDVPAPRPDKLKILTDYFDNEVASGKLPAAWPPGLPKMLWRARRRDPAADDAGHHLRAALHDQADHERRGDDADR